MTTTVTSAQLLQRYSTTRITDISYTACKDIELNKIVRSDLLKLYQYHLNLSTTNALYPQTNWQAHRLMVLSCIAVFINDATRMKQCDTLIRQWIPLSDCTDNCGANSQDYHWRDSVTYLVYGVQALCQACLYLQRKNQWAYKTLLKPFIDFIRPYEAGTKTHIEFVNSQNMPDDMTKLLYNKPYPKGYAKQLLTMYGQLTL